ncbi:MAG TPA: hypothetical protein VGB20_07025 [bacterium]
MSPDDNTLVNAFETVVVQPVQAFGYQLMRFLPQLLGALVIFAFGCVLAKAIERVFVKLLKVLGLDKLSDQTQLSSALARGGLRRRLSELLGAVVYWLVMLAVVMVTFNALGLTVAAELFQRVVSFLPNVIAALFIFIIGIFAAVFLGASVRTAVINAGMSQAGLLAQLAQTIVIIFASVAALQQLQIQFVGEVFLIILGGVSLALGLAFGLGCKDLAGQWVQRLIQQVQSKRE